MLKGAFISYHKNIYDIYPQEWIDMHVSTVTGQKCSGIDIFEIDYGGSGVQIFKNSFFESIELPTFVHAMNFLIGNVFELGYDFTLNLNSDDFYSLDRVTKQIKMIEQGYELVSSNFCLVKDDAIIHTHKFENVDIEAELERGHNVICHPVVAMSKSFWEKNGPYNPDDVPREDLIMWQKGIKNSCFIILPDVLHYQRIHGNSVCKSQNR